MGCTIATEQYIPVVENLIKLNSEVYKNFDNAAKFILQSDLTGEQKKLALHNMAHIYNGLSGLDATVYNLGKGIDIIKGVNLIDDTKAYIKFSSDLFGIKESLLPTSTGIDKSIEALTKLSLITVTDLTNSIGPLSLIKQYFFSHTFETLEERASTIESFREMLRDVISNMSKVDESYKEVLYSTIEDVLSTLEKKSEYIDINTVVDLANLDTVLLTLDNGSMVEGIMYDDGTIDVVDSDGNLQPIEASRIVSKKPSRPADSSYSNDGKQVFNEDFFLSGLVIDAVNAEERPELIEALKKMSVPSAGIKISAVKLSNVGDIRVQRMKEVAFQEVSLAPLSRRDHETFENSTQVAYLESTPNGKVLTVSRPKASEQQFALVGEILATGQKFYIYSMENFAFVSSDNTTELLDLSNPGHLAMLQEMSVKSTTNSTSPLENSDMASIVASQKLYESFKEKVLAKVGSAFDADTSVDVTDEFVQMYDFSTQRGSSPVYKLLNEAVESNPQFSKEVTVVDVNASNEIVNEETRKLPFYFYKEINYKTKTIQYRPVSFLKGNQRIKVELPDGTIKIITEQSYINEVLKLPEQITEMFKDEDARLVGLMNNNESLAKVAKTMHFVVKFPSDGSISYASARRNDQLEFGEFFAKYIVSLSEVLSSPQKTTALRNFRKLQYDFMPSAISGKGMILSYEFATARAAEGYQLQLEVRPYSQNSDRYGSAITNETKRFFNFKIDEGMVNGLAKSLKGEGSLLKEVVADNPSLAGYDLNKSDDLLSFYTDVYAMSASGIATDSIKKLVSEISKAQQNFTQAVIDSVIKPLQENKEGVYTDFMELAKEDFNFTNGVNLEAMFSSQREDGTKSLRVVSPSVVGAPNDNRSTYNSSMKNLSILESGSRKSFKLVAKTAINVAPSDQVSDNMDHTAAQKAIVDEVAETENQPVAITLVDTNDTPLNLKEEGDVSDQAEEDDDVIDIEPFSIASGEIQVATNDEILSEAEWLAEMLPQFGLDRTTLKDVINLSKIDGAVLGMFKDKMIYLNEALPSKGTVFHEAFHGVFRYLLTQRERDALIADVVNNPTHASKFDADAVYEFARVRNITTTDFDTLIQLIAEEVLADGFQNYMAKAKPSAPKTAMQRFFDMLKRLLALFMKNKSEIENTYDKIKTGYYKTATIQSNVFDGHTAFEVIPGLVKYYSNEEGATLRAQSTLNPSEQVQLVNMVVGVIFQDKVQTDNFDTKFQRAVDKVLEEVYSMEKLVSQNPAMKDAIIAKYGPMISSFRFVLGARMKGLSVMDINLSGDIKNDNKQSPNTINLINDEKIDNTMGQHSFDVLRKIVKEKFDKTNSVKIAQEQDEFTVVDDEVAATFSGENANVVVDDEAQSAREELESNDFESSFGEQNRMDSYVSQIRRFLSTIRNDQFDADLGINLPRMVDGDYIFPTMLKITAGLAPQNIIDSIGVMGKQMIKDGFTQSGKDLSAIADAINVLTKADPEGNPQSNRQLRQLLIEVLHGIELNYTMFNVSTPKEVSIEETTNMNDLMQSKAVTFRLYDKVVDADITKKRNDIVANFLKKHSSSANDAAFKEAVDVLINFPKEWFNQPDLLSGLRGQTIMAMEFTNKIHKALETIGMTIPRSLVELSILGMNKAENNIDLEVDTQMQKFYDVNDNFIKQGQYLEKDFFRSLSYILTNAYVDNKPNVRLKTLMDDQNAKDAQINRFMVILKKASSYIVKYDPTDIPSVIKNAEGKSIYRFAKYNPLALLTERLNTMTLEEALSNDPYFTNSLKNFISDNAVLGPLMKNEKGTDVEKIQLFLDNFTMSMFGGVQQRIGDVAKQGQTFKSIDERSLYMLQLLSFMNMKSIRDKNGNEITTYMRPFHQLEATQTNFLVSAMYTPFVSKANVTPKNPLGHALYQEKYWKVVEDLEATVKQEYKRIAREWNRRLELKANYENGVSNELNNNYNAILNSDKKTANVDDSSLRAYKFNILSDFFQNDNNSSLASDLVELAKSQRDFDSIELTDLRDALNDFAKEQFQMYMETLERIQLIQKLPIPEGQKLVDPRPTAPKFDTYFEASMLPEKMKLDFASTALTEMYPQPQGVNPKTTNPLTPIESLLYDKFMNNWRNALHFNQLMDGDMAMNVKNPQDYVKRLKKIVATGSNMKDGTHNVAYMNTITAFVHDMYPQYGPYYKREEIISDFMIESEALRDELLEGYDKAINGAVEGILDTTVKWGDMIREVFDGQSISSLMHQMDMYDTLGRLDDRGLYILVAKNYRALTEDETRYLESMKIVNNAKKTVTAGRNVYHKNSEAYIDRTDVSILNINKTEDETVDVATERAFNELHGLYMSVYDLRKSREEAAKMPDAANQVAMINSNIGDIYLKIHNYYTPLPHRQMMHDILNSMEIHQVDQLMDTTASKNATLLPVDVFNSDKKDGYINFGLSTLAVPNSAKYLQVETSGVKDKAKHSIQAKLLLPADISEKEFRKIIEVENERTGIPATESEVRAMLDVKNALNDYQLSLSKSTKARLTYFKNVLRKGNDFELGKIFTMIRESLQQQNAPMNILEMFAVKADGKPVFSPNLSLIRNTLEYYMIAQYSKNVTDEKVAGFKNFHESAFGYEVMVDLETGAVVTTQEIAENPDAFKDQARFRSRPLSTTVEIQADGSKLYFVECIVPKPYFENAQQEAFYMKNLTKMFGVRIPTEDKRSMIALKVVDFVDSSKLNNIIVPHFVHMLAGSDFDIDSLFGRMMSYYKNGRGNFSLYGDYSQYQDMEKGEFIEFLHFMSKNEDFGPLIKARKKQLIDDGTISIPSTGVLFDIMSGLGYTMYDLEEFFDQKVLKSKYKDQKEFTSYMFDLTTESKELYVNAKEIADQNPENRELANTRNAYGKEHADLKAVRQTSVAEQKAIREKLRIVDSAFEYQAMLDVMAQYGLPSNLSEFLSKPQYSDMVSKKYENANLEASLRILGNEAVFKYLYINQRASANQFLEILSKFGIDMKTITQKANLFTPTNMVASKIENNMNKDGIGRTAVMNKFLALASQYELVLDDDAIVWNFQDLNGKFVSKDTFGQLNEKDQRVISIIGNILGVFADAAKDPIPAALQMNEVNASTTLAMIGIGLDPEFAVAFNFLPEVRKAALAVQQSQFAISEGLEQDYKFYNSAITTQIEDLINEDPDTLTRLKVLGIASEKSWAGRVMLDSSKVKIGFEPKGLSIYALKNDLLTPSAIGFEMRDAMTDVPLSENEMKVVLLSLYAKQAQQTWSMNRVASMTNLFKRLNPSLVAFDKMRDNIQEIKENKLFNEASVDRLFKGDQVWNVLEDTLNDANDQFSKIFLERTLFFKPITASFKRYFEDPKTIANTLTSFLAISKFKMTFPNSRSSKNAYMQGIIDQDNAAILQTFTPEYWFTNDLYTQIEKMREKYPENDFLKLLRPDESENTATVIYNGKPYPNIKERFVKLIGKAKIKGDYANKIADDITFLYNQGTVDEKLFVKRLFYHELARTGLQYAEGSFISYMPAELKVPVSNYIEEFIVGLEQVAKSSNFEEDFVSFMKDYIGKDSQVDIYKFFDEMFSQLAYAASSENNNQKIPTFRDKKDTASMSFKVNSKNPQFTKGIVKAFIPEGSPLEKSMLPDAKAKALAHVYTAFGYQTPIRADLDKIGKVNIVDLAGNDFTLDLSTSTQEELKANMILGSMFGIRRDPSDPDSNDFVFPAIVRVGTKTFILQGVDTGAESMKSIGSNLVDAIVGKGVFTSIGTLARYTAIPSQYSSKSLSPIGFTTEDAETYNRYVTKKEGIVLNAEVVDDNAKAQIENPAKPLEDGSLIPLSAAQRFNRKSVEQDSEYLYLFTDNAQRSSGTGKINADGWYAQKYGATKKYPGKTQAVARGLDNAYPITTMVDDKRTQWSDVQFDTYKAIIDDEIEAIKKAVTNYKGIKFGAEMPFGKGAISNMRDSAPKIWAYLNTKLAELGIDNTGETPVASVKPQSDSATANQISSGEDLLNGIMNEGKDNTSDVSEDQIEAGEDFLKAFMAGQIGETNAVVPKIQAGRFVTYKGTSYIVTQQNANGTWQIYNPLLEGAAAKISVSETNLKANETLAKIVEYNGAEYIVTPKNTIISLTSNKKMKWDDDNGDRKAVLALARQNKTIIKPNNRPSIDPTDENNC